MGMGAGAGATLKPTWTGGDFPWAVESLGRSTLRAGRRQGAAVRWPVRWPPPLQEQPP